MDGASQRSNSRSSNRKTHSAEPVCRGRAVYGLHVVGICVSKGGLRPSPPNLAVTRCSNFGIKKRKERQGAIVYLHLRSYSPWIKTSESSWWSKYSICNSTMVRYNGTSSAGSPEIPPGLATTMQISLSHEAQPRCLKSDGWGLICLFRTSVPSRSIPRDR